MQLCKWIKMSQILETDVRSSCPFSKRLLDFRMGRSFGTLIIKPSIFSKNENKTRKRRNEMNGILK